MKIIRLATVADAPEILAIYAPYITGTSYTFEYDVPSVEDFGRRIGQYLTSHPWLVCEIDGQIAGYAYGSHYRERKGYQWSCECSVYIADAFQHIGAGKALYGALMEILKKQGYVNVYAVINLPNPKSVSFHESMGFSWLATYDHVGYKLGKWKDVGWWQLRINPFADEPAAPIAFNQVNTDFLPALFQNAAKKIREPKLP